MTAYKKEGFLPLPATKKVFLNILLSGSGVYRFKKSYKAIVKI
ncbi:hypothetical protein DB41_IF00040 [Neochlamydia sp. TUME1]|nr:hypothetical protein DB41_IF00040 [Neochlamydia sp. TUME1]